MIAMRLTSIVLLVFLFVHDSLRGAAGDEFWDDRFDSLGIDGEVWAIAVMGKDVYVGGQFSKAGNVEAANIARWDGTNWWTLGTGVDRAGVRALAAGGTNLWVGGLFNRVSDIETGGIAKWDGSKWSSLGTGRNTTATLFHLRRFWS